MNDTDVIYDHKKILSAIGEYHSRFEGKVLSVYGMMIMPYKVANLLHGWKNLDRHEDNEIALNAFVHNLHAPVSDQLLLPVEIGNSPIFFLGFTNTGVAVMFNFSSAVFYDDAGNLEKLAV